MDILRRSVTWFGQIAVFAAVLSLPARAGAQQDLEQLEGRAVKAAVARVAPSVVRIETFGGLEKVGRLLVGTGPTTGLVVSEDGYVISSAFNFVQQPASILVTLPTGKRMPAEIVARDDSRMLVLLKVHPGQRLVVPAAVPLDEMAVGQWAIAVGRTFELDQPNLSVGILSALNRIWGKAIQTDAKVSPSNYGGPLVDIRGRVLGVLVPLAPQGGGEIAGAEWYDSGIGFAVPLDQIHRHLDKMKRGEDLHAGILGISLKGGDLYADPPVIAAVPAKSPAAEAGLQPGDRIIEIDGVKIVRQAQLRHALGPRYAGEKVRVAVLRGEERIEKTIQLTDKVAPYEHPFLGILPRRASADGPGVGVRYVYPGSPAEAAGIQVDDRIVRLAERQVPSAAAMQEMIAAYEPGQSVKLDVQRGGQTRHLVVQLARLPTEIPASLPPARGPERPPAAGDRPPVGIVQIKIPEEKNDCFAYVPPSYRPDVAYGLVVWLHAPGGFDRDALVQRWRQHCETRGLILLAPQSADPQRWQRTEADFIRKTIDDLMADYRIDGSRIVLHGYQAGGTMAYLVALAHRDLIRGVAVVDAALPRRTRPPANDPVLRLAVYMTTAKQSKLREAIQAGAKRLRELKFPVTVKDLGDRPRYLEADEIAELVRWIDTLDRI